MLTEVKCDRCRVTIGAVDKDEHIRLPRIFCVPCGELAKAFSTMINCPNHKDTNPSAIEYGDGRTYCFKCGLIESEV